MTVEMDREWASKIMNGADKDKMTPEQREKADALSAFVTKWSLASESERESNLPTYDAINEAFFDSDIDKLHDQALKLRTALSEIDSGILSHARNVIAFSQEVKSYDDPADEKNVPDFLKAVPVELRDRAVQEVIMSEVAGIAMRLMQYDLDHVVEG